MYWSCCEKEEDFGEDETYNLTLISSTARRTAWTCAQHRLKNPGPIKWTSPAVAPPSSSTPSLSPPSPPASHTSPPPSSSSPPPTLPATQSPPASTTFPWFTEVKEIPKKVTKPAFSQFSQLIATIEATDYHGGNYHASDYHGGDYHAGDYHASDYHASDYHANDFEASSSSPPVPSTKSSSTNVWLTTEKSSPAPWETIYGPTTAPPWCVTANKRHSKL